MEMLAVIGGMMLVLIPFGTLRSLADADPEGMSFLDWLMIALPSGIGFIAGAALALENLLLAVLGAVLGLGVVRAYEWRRRRGLNPDFVVETPLLSDAVDRPEARVKLTEMALAVESGKGEKPPTQES